MIRLAMVSRPLSDADMRLAKQMGMTDVVTTMPGVTMAPERVQGPAWNYVDLLHLRKRVEAAGLVLSVIEGYSSRTASRWGCRGATRTSRGCARRSPTWDGSASRSTVTTSWRSSTGCAPRPPCADVVMRWSRGSMRPTSPAHRSPMRARRPTRRCGRTSAISCTGCCPWRRPRTSSSRCIRTIRPCRRCWGWRGSCGRWTPSSACSTRRTARPTALPSARAISPRWAPWTCPPRSPVRRAQEALLRPLPRRPRQRAGLRGDVPRRGQERTSRRVHARLRRHRL